MPATKVHSTAGYPHLTLARLMEVPLYLFAAMMMHTVGPYLHNANPFVHLSAAGIRHAAVAADMVAAALVILAAVDALTLAVKEAKLMRAERAMR